MKVFEMLPRPLGYIFRKLTHFACNSPNWHAIIVFGSPSVVCVWRIGASGFRRSRL